MFSAFPILKNVHHDKSFSPWQTVGIINRESESILFPSLEKEGRLCLLLLTYNLALLGFRYRLKLLCGKSRASFPSHFCSVCNGELDEKDVGNGGKKKSATGILFCGFCDHKCSVTIFLLESRPPVLTMASLCRSFPRGVRRTSHQARRRRGLHGASGSKTGRSGSSRARLRKPQSGVKEQVGPDRAGKPANNSFLTFVSSPNQWSSKL